MLYAAAVFVSAFLLFQVQPLISRYILPWFGGTPAVWTTCMLFFQVTLFAGYAYAHFAAARMSPWTQCLMHLLLLGGALATLPIIPDAAWKPTGEEQPIWQIVSLLAATVGLPFFVLSTTGPLLQHWFSRTEPGRSPYRLYALSNVGSLLALLSYPFVVEPLLPTTTQARYWSWGFVAFAGVCALAALRMVSKFYAMRDESTVAASIAESESGGAQVGLSPGFGRVLLWFALAMVPSVLLLAITNQVCMDIASVPFLWVVPLSLYLLSFILCFDSDKWYSRRMFVPMAFVLCGGVAAALIGGAGVELWLQLFVNFGALFVIAMVCHGELVRLKPDPKHLTAFYLIISAGGAAGGLFAGVLAPLVFRMYLELHIGLVAFGLLCLIVLFRDLNYPRFQLWPPSAGSLAWFTMFNATLAIAVAVGVHVQRDTTYAVSVSRNFYGVLRVLEKSDPENPEDDMRELMHGRILHGMQFPHESRRHLPTTYYSHASGIGRILDSRPDEQPRRVGLVGLGAGTLATYAEPGDVFRFYDINPEVVRLARTYFTYLDDCQGEVQISLGDARLSLENEENQQFDVLALDAFSSDAIPIHLLTIEAAEIYLRHLKPRGVLAVHISNRHFNLRPVVDAIADHFHLASATIEAEGDEEPGDSVSVWVLLCRELEPLTANLILETALDQQPKRIVWTDDRSNLVEVLRLLETDESEEEPSEDPSPTDAVEAKQPAVEAQPQPASAP